VSLHEVKPKVSVVLCTFNGATYVEELLNSVLTQTLRPAELVVFDDGSSDSTLKIIDRILSGPLAVGIDLHIQQNSQPLGVAKNFSGALKTAKYSLITLADQDDVWYPNRLEKLAEWFSGDSRILLVHSDADVIDSGGQKIGSLLGHLRITRAEKRSLVAKGGLGALLRRNLVTGTTVMLRRDLLDTGLPVPGRFMHDEWLALVAAMRGGVKLDTDKLVAYRQHGKNVVGVRRTPRLLSGLMVARSTFQHPPRVLSNRVEALQEFMDNPVEWVPRDARDALEKTVKHQIWRSQLASHRLLRVIPVLVSLMTRRYSRCGRGLADAFADF